MRRAEERHLLVVEVGRARTTGSAWIGFADERRHVEPRIARRELDASVAHGDGMDDVASLDDVPRARSSTTSGSTAPDP